MRTSILWALAIVISTSALLVFSANPAWADQSYHTERLTFHALDESPDLRAGQVINSHSNGPIRYAHEGYMVNGAAPDTSYDVYIEIFFGSACDGTPDLAMQTATIQTNQNGDGHASHVFVPEDVAPFNPPLTVHARWVLQEEGTARYQTDCTVIKLD